MELKGLRHPVVEMQKSIKYVPNDIRLEEKVSTMNIITGPNMGGKSTHVRSVAIAVVMALIGSFVPCESAIIPIFDAIFSRIEAEDCITKGQSTFMVEMAESANIVQVFLNIVQRIILLFPLILFSLN